MHLVTSTRIARCAMAYASSWEGLKNSCWKASQRASSRADTAPLRGIPPSASSGTVASVPAGGGKAARRCAPRRRLDTVDIANRLGEEVVDADAERAVAGDADPAVVGVEEDPLRRARLQ